LDLDAGLAERLVRELLGREAVLARIGKALA